jgi:hypothetical protein
MDSPTDWLATRTPPAPDELNAWLKIPDGGTDADTGMASVPGSLLKAGLVHLEHAVARPGRDRTAAYQLLAADALITYGCEAASEARDVRSALREVLVGVRTGGAVE